MIHVLLGIKYLDPGSGSLLVQLLAAGLLGSAGLLVKIFWGRIKAFIRHEKYVAPGSQSDDGEAKDE